MSKQLGRPITFVEDCIGEEVEAEVAKMVEGEVLLLENVRFYAGEEKNDPEFAAALAKVADAFVNDAFGRKTAPTPRQRGLLSTSHHVSVVF